MTDKKLIDAIALFDKDIFTNSPNQLRLIINAARENEQLRKELNSAKDAIELRTTCYDQLIKSCRENERLHKERDELAGVMKYIYTQAKANHPQALTVIAMNAERFINDKKDT